MPATLHDTPGEPASVGSTARPSLRAGDSCSAYEGSDREELLAEAESVLLRSGVVEKGDLIVLTIGEPIGKAGGTNTMKIVKVGEHPRP